MKLIDCKLSNFMGIADFYMRPGGKDVIILGTNGAGKTTVATALSWLLFGKDSKGGTKFEIKTTGADGQPLHNLEHTVLATFEDGTGKQIVLGKVYKETWATKRGSKTAEFTGHTTEYLIDGVPVQAKEYQQKVAERLATEDLFRLLTSPSYFSEDLPWQQRRALLLSVCGNITDADVIAENEELAPLAAITRPLDDEKKVIKATMTKINESLKSIPARIDELFRQQAEEIDLAAEKKSLAKMTAEKARLEADKIRIESGGKDHAAIEAVAEEIAALREAFRAEKCGKILDLNNRLTGLRDQGRMLLDQANNFPVPVDHEARIIELVSQMEAKRQQWHTVNEALYTIGACPTCGQDMPEEEGAEGAFNQRKAEQLTQINNAGEELKKAWEAAGEAKVASEKAVAEQEERRIETRGKLDLVRAEIREVEDEIISLNGVTIETSVSAGELQVLLDKRAALDLPAGDTTDVTAQIGVTAERIATIQGRIAAADLAAKNKIRMAELDTEEKRLGAEYEAQSQMLYLIEQFTRAKVKMLEGQVAAKFPVPGLSFKLFQEQINSGISDCCEVLYNGIAYGSNLNNGARVTIGMEIIKVLAEHYNFRPMVVVDNSESVVALPKMDCQVIRLVVSPDHQTLTVEA